jgi:hypothetical protein
VGKYFPPNTFCLPDCPYETDTFFFIVSASIPFELIFPDASRGNDFNVIAESSYESSHESSYAPSPPPLGNYDSPHGDNSIYRHAKVVRVIKLIRLLKLFRVLRGAYFPLTTFRLPGLPIRDWHFRLLSLSHAGNRAAGTRPNHPARRVADHKVHRGGAYVGALAGVRVVLGTRGAEK